MRRAARSAAVAAGLLGVLCAAGAPAVRAQEGIEAEIAGARDEIERLQREIAALDRQIVRLERAGASAADRLRAAQRRLEQRRREVRLHRTRLLVVQRELEKARGDVGRLSKALETHRRLLGRRAVALFRRTRAAEYEILISASDLVDLGRRVRFLDAVARADAALIERTIGEKDAAEKAAARLAAKRREMDEVHSDLVRAMRAEDRARAEAQQAKNRAEREARAARARREEATRSLAELRSLLVRLQERARGIRGEARRGRLARPVPGEVFVPEELAGILGGAYLRTPAGTEVRAAAPGRVIHVGSLRGFGTTVIVGHADGVVTIYGNLSAAGAVVGREVREGEPLGLSGTTRYGPALYFSIRVQNVAQDVNAWLE